MLLRPHLSGSLCIVLWIAAYGTARAQHAGSAPAADKAPIETFDLTRALVTDGPGLTADEVAQLAVRRSAQMAGSQALAESARWDTRAQWAALLPTLSFFAQYKRISEVTNSLTFVSPEQVAQLPAALQPLFANSSGANFTQPLDNFSGGASLRIPASDLFMRLWPAYSGSKTLAQARTIQVESTQAEVALRARDAFYAYVRAVAFRAVADQALKQAEAQAQQTKLFVNAGTAAPVDLMNATARLEQRRGDLARTEGSVAITRTALSTATGLAPEAVAAIHEPVTELPEPLAMSYEDLLARALSQRPELRALRKVAEANIHLETAERNAALPQLVLEGNLLYANPNPRFVPPEKEFHASWDVGATLLWTPNQALTGRAKGRRMEAEVAKARADVVALSDAVRVEVTQAFEDHKSATATARSAEAALTAAEEAYRVRRAMYKVGAGVVQDLLDADLLLTQQRLSHVSAVIDARSAQARLRRAAAITP